MNQALRITLDGGTTNTRAMLVDGEQVIDQVSTAVGVRESRADQPSPVLAAVGQCLATLAGRHNVDPARTPVIASGMVGSEAGLANVPHQVAPATPVDAASALYLFEDASVWPAPIQIIPGVRTGPNLQVTGALRQALGEDVMRGEETQAWGLWRILSSRDPKLTRRHWLIVWPGSHTKLILVGPEGAILGSFTTLAGELFAAFKSATLLRRSLPEEMPGDYSEDLLDLVNETVNEEGLLRAAFWTRVSDIRSHLNANQRAAWLSSAVIAEDVRTLARHPWMRQFESAPIYVGGDEPRRSLYRKLLARSVAAEVITLAAGDCERASAVGAVFVDSLRTQAGR